MSNHLKWSKIFSALTEEQKWINNDFLHYWHTVLPEKYTFIKNFNHNYVIKSQSINFMKTLEIGAGLGEHFFYESLSNEQRINYVALELRENIAETIKTNHPDIQILVSDCQKKISVSDHEFDRIIAIYVLKHLSNLLEAIFSPFRFFAIYLV